MPTSYRVHQFAQLGCYGEGAAALRPPRASETDTKPERLSAASGQRCPLVERWRALVDAETLGDEELKRDALDSFSRRRQWPDGMRRYIASLYELDVDTWQRVTDFIDRAATIDGKNAGGTGSLRSLG